MVHISKRASRAGIVALLQAALVPNLPAQNPAGQAPSDGAIVADFQRRVSSAIDSLRHHVTIEQFGPDHDHVPYRGKWIKRWCILGDFAFDVRRTESLVSPIVAVAEGTTEQLSVGPFHTREDADTAALVPRRLRMGSVTLRINYALQNNTWVLTSAWYQNRGIWEELWRGPLGRRDHSFCAIPGILELR